jgi:hypothetical protein
MNDMCYAFSVVGIVPIAIDLSNFKSVLLFSFRQFAGNAFHYGKELTL